ncbi:related to multicopper oxidase [Phialocephala subalpina]|uniref:Related to multicopper oxidase n=1 Tax=Phialocephala subalpina TaxID=576137 RepID=A0A1L7XV17_9HELO|nr:related to multicopper oxidase [Phialocephala subalpina]
MAQAKDEETFELLRDEVVEEQEQPGYELRKRRIERGIFSKTLRPLGFVFAALFLITILSRDSSVLFRSAPPSTSIDSVEDVFDDYAQEKMLGIRLHPQDHVSRPPTTITHHWNITAEFHSPDGVKKLVYLVNGQFPGPTIECRSGDRLVIHVTNHLVSEGVSIHWHGLEMRNANEMDGAVGFTQCPIAERKTSTYEFEVGEEQAGTFWWHAHSEVGRGDGMYGGLVIHEQTDVLDDTEDYGYEDDVLLLIGDWYHRTAREVLAWYTSTRGFGNEPVPDSLLVNGAGKFICSMAVPARPVECVDIEDKDMTSILGAKTLTKPTRLRLVNVGSLAGFTIQISSAKLKPLTVDGGFPIVGEFADSVGIVYPGERLDVLVQWDNQASSNFPQLHISLDPEYDPSHPTPAPTDQPHRNFKYPNQALRPNQSFPVLTSSSQTSSSIAREPVRFDLATAVAASPSAIPSTPDQTILLYAKTQKLSIDNNHPSGFMNRTSWSPQSSPPFPLISLPRSKWDANQLIPYIPASSNSETWVDIVINNLDDGAHPFHLHGYSFYILASYRSDHGWGSYSPYATSGASAMKPKLNLENPIRKDTVSVPRRGYVVIRFKADNEGIWVLHCHVLFHQASGMAMGIQVGGGEGHEIVDERGKEFCAASS